MLEAMGATTTRRCGEADGPWGLSQYALEIAALNCISIAMVKTIAAATIELAIALRLVFVVTTQTDIEIVLGSYQG